MVVSRLVQIRVQLPADAEWDQPVTLRRAVMLNNEHRNSSGPRAAGDEIDSVDDFRGFKGRRRGIEQTGLDINHQNSELAGSTRGEQINGIRRRHTLTYRNRNSFQPPVRKSALFKPESWVSVRRAGWDLLTGTAESTRERSVLRLRTSS